MSENSLDFLFSDEEIESQEDLIPESEMFLQGNIGPWEHCMMYETNDGIKQGPKEIEDFKKSLGEENKPDFVDSKPYGTSYYYHLSRRDSAKFVHELVGGNYSPNVVWLWRIKSNEIMNWGNQERSAEDTLGEYLCLEAILPPTYGNNYARHEFHMYALPSFVQSIITMMSADERFADVPGIDHDVKWPIFDYDSLYKINTKENDQQWAKDGKPKLAIPQALTDIQEEWIGTDGNNYTESKLWQVRKDIFLALLEENSAAYKIDNTSKFSAKSNMLRRILSMVYQSSVSEEFVSSEYYYRVNGRVPNLRADAVTKWDENKKNAEGENTSGRRVSGFVISEAYPNKAAAEAVIGSDDDGFMPELPSDWKQPGSQQFIDHMKNHLEERSLLGKPWPIAKAQLSSSKEEKSLNDDCLCSLDQLEQWWGFLN